MRRSSWMLLVPLVVGLLAAPAGAGASYSTGLSAVVCDGSTVVLTTGLGNPRPEPRDFDAQLDGSVHPSGWPVTVDPRGQAWKDDAVSGLVAGSTHRWTVTSEGATLIDTTFVAPDCSRPTSDPSVACHAVVVQALGLGIESVNVPSEPCETHAKRLTSLTVPLGAPLPYPFNAYRPHLTITLAEASTRKEDRYGSAIASVASLDIQAPLQGLSIYAEGLHSDAWVGSGETGPQCPSQVVGAYGWSSVASLSVNYSHYSNLSAPRKISIPGGGAVYLNRQQVRFGAVKQTALFVDLPGTASDVAVAQSEASIHC